MAEFYCKCLNVCLSTDSSPSCFPFLGTDNLAEDERNHEFFGQVACTTVIHSSRGVIVFQVVFFIPFLLQLPLVVTHVTEVKKEQPLLIELVKVGTWTLYKCINCLTYLYAISKTNGSTVMNNSLSQVCLEVSYISYAQVHFFLHRMYDVMNYAFVLD